MKPQLRHGSKNIPKALDKAKGEINKAKVGMPRNLIVCTGG